MIKCKPSYNGVATKRCSWPPGTCVTPFSSNARNTRQRVVHQKWLRKKKKKTCQKRRAMDNFIRTNSLPITFLTVEENNPVHILSTKVSEKKRSLVNLFSDFLTTRYFQKKKTEPRMFASKKKRAFITSPNIGPCQLEMVQVRMMTTGCKSTLRMSTFLKKGKGTGKCKHQT